MKFRSQLHTFNQFVDVLFQNTPRLPMSVLMKTVSDNWCAMETSTLNIILICELKIYFGRAQEQFVIALRERRNHVEGFWRQGWSRDTRWSDIQIQDMTIKTVEHLHNLYSRNIYKTCYKFHNKTNTFISKLKFEFLMKNANQFGIKTIKMIKNPFYFQHMRRLLIFIGHRMVFDDSFWMVIDSVNVVQVQEMCMAQVFHIFGSVQRIYAMRRLERCDDVQHELKLKF